MTRDRERCRQKYHKKEVGNVKAIQIEALRKLDSIELKVLETAAEQLGGTSPASIIRRLPARWERRARRSVIISKNLWRQGCYAPRACAAFPCARGFLSRYSRQRARSRGGCPRLLRVRNSRRRFEAAGQNSHGECSSVNKGKKEVHTAQFFTTE